MMPAGNIPAGQARDKAVDAERASLARQGSQAGAPLKHCTTTPTRRPPTGQSPGNRHRETRDIMRLCRHLRLLLLLSIIAAAVAFALRPGFAGSSVGEASAGSMSQAVNTGVEFELSKK